MLKGVLVVEAMLVLYVIKFFITEIKKNIDLGVHKISI